MRVGFGFGNEELSKRLEIQSSGISDVVYLTIADALLGAAGLGGLLTKSRPDLVRTGKSAVMILNDVERMIHYAGYRIVNADISLLERDEAITDTILEGLCGALFLKKEEINIKMAPVLPEKMICFSVVLLNHRNQ